MMGDHVAFMPDYLVIGGSVRIAVGLVGGNDMEVLVYQDKGIGV